MKVSGCIFHVSVKYCYHAEIYISMYSKLKTNNFCVYPENMNSFSFEFHGFYEICPLLFLILNETKKT